MLGRPDAWNFLSRDSNGPANVSSNVILEVDRPGIRTELTGVENRVAMEPVSATVEFICSRLGVGNDYCRSRGAILRFIVSRKNFDLVHHVRSKLEVTVN